MCLFVLCSLSGRYCLKESWQEARCYSRWCSSSPFFSFPLSFVQPALPSSVPPGSGWHLVSNHQHAGTEALIHFDSSANYFLWLLYVKTVHHNFSGPKLTYSNFFCFVPPRVWNPKIFNLHWYKTDESSMSSNWRSWIQSIFVYMNEN